jgi:hypothetical protein
VALAGRSAAALVFAVPVVEGFRGHFNIKINN